MHCIGYRFVKLSMYYALSGIYYIIYIVLYLDVNECTVDNGGCEDTCVNTFGSFHCECGDGLKLSSNNKTCQGLLWPHVIIKSAISLIIKVV